MNIHIPYGKAELTLTLPPERVAAVLESKAHGYQAEAGEAELVRRAMAAPVGTPKLQELARGKKNIVIIVSDHTRPVPTQVIAPLLLEEIQKGSPQAQVTFLVATGLHRGTTEEELREKFGPDLYGKVRIVVHDCWNKESLVQLEKLPSGGELWLNKVAADADLLLAEGFIEPHLFAGFSGGRKSVLPGIVGDSTIRVNHCAEHIAHAKARVGMLEGNPIHEDMLHAARQAKLAYIVNVVIDAQKKVIGAFAGDVEQAHLQGCAFLQELAAVAAVPADIVVTTNGGYPLDQNIYQHVKGLSSAEATCKKGGVIIVCADLGDGHGSAELYEWLQKGAAAVTKTILAVDRYSTVPDQWATQIMARIQCKHKVIFVTAPAQHEVLRRMGFAVVETFEEALTQAEATVGKEAKITVIPDGVAVIVR